MVYEEKESSIMKDNITKKYTFGLILKAFAEWVGLQLEQSNLDMTLLVLDMGQQVCALQ